MSGRTFIWTIEVSNKGRYRKGWSPTSLRWFGTRKEAQEYIATEIHKDNFEFYEYRARKYVAEVRAAEEGS